jgi:hypothetical protein
LDDTTFSQIVRLIIVAILGVITFFLKRILGDLDNVRKEVEELKIKVAVILDRDRQHRLEDYDDQASHRRD